ncbi:macrophage migration inhibitory factor-like [Oncorhynchus clarkii lewisi]|uniref:macrophage migration inhibitory factor-like n=1 Tax=Oncorhynchus clarkii lewisi TaxID=490388 RepID=UPI0039B8D9AB
MNRSTACAEDQSYTSVGPIRLASSKLTTIPVFMVNTNYAKASVPAALLSEATVELTFFVAPIVLDQLMTLGRKTAPCTYCSLHSIGAISEEQNLQYSTLLCGLLNKHLEISPLIYMNFFEMVVQNLAWDNTMFKVFIEAYHAKK